MSAPRRPTRDDKQVGVYVGQFRRRYAAFCRAHDDDLKEMSHDAMSRMFSEHIVHGRRSAFEQFLAGMLTEPERDRLNADPEFTLAWRIFVDLCWTKKQIKRAAIILVAIVLLMLGIVAFILSIPQVAKGPLPQ